MGHLVQALTLDAHGNESRRPRRRYRRNVRAAADTDSDALRSINALWINGLATVAGLLERLGQVASRVRAIESQARGSFPDSFLLDGRCRDVVGDPQLRPNQLLAVSLPNAPLRERSVVESCAPLLTSIGLRSLSRDDPAYIGRHQGSPAERDRAYHQGTVWPWLIGPYVEAALRTDVPVDGLLDGLEAHLQ